MPRGKKKEQADPKVELMKSVGRWRDLYENGGTDPFYEDGSSLNLVRNHIIYYIGECEKAGIKVDVKIPDEVDSKYMARAEEIRKAAPQVLAQYKADANYQWLVKIRSGLSPKIAKDSSIDNVIGYATGLEIAIKADDLVGMRRHTHGFYDNKPSHYLDSFASCRRSIETMLGNTEEEEDMGRITELENTVNELQSKIEALVKENAELKAKLRVDEPETEIQLTKEQQKMFKTQLEKLSGIKEIKVHANRTWLWVGGDTKQHKDLLKGLGFRWSGKRNEWYLIGQN